MTREQVELMMVFNDPSVQRALEAYVEYRVNVLHAALERAPEEIHFRQAQGAVQEVRRLTTLRDEVVAKAKEYR